MAREWLQRLAFLVVSVVLAVPHVVVAQEAREATHVYEAYFRVARGNLDAWHRLYRDYSVPILTRLQDDGVIVGWNQWQHDTGGEYNIRFSVRTSTWASIETFWNRYLAGLDAAGASNTLQRMIRDHRDEIWDIEEDENSPATGVSSHLYTSTYQVGYADLEEWNRLWLEIGAPILRDAIDQGLLRGWVLLGHNTGGPHNSKLLFFFADWDDIDDMWETVTARWQNEHPQEWAAMLRMRDGHSDTIWTPTPDEEE